MFCDIRIHEQIKRMNAIQQELDHFQITCEEIIQSTLQSNTENEISTELLRADQFLQTTMKIQSELIGHALLEIEENDSIGFHSQITTLKEQFITQVNNIRRKHSRKNNTKEREECELIKKKTISQIMQYGKEELQVEYKHCVDDIMDFASNSAKLFYRKLALQYWILLSHYKEKGNEETIYEQLTTINQEIMEQFNEENEKGRFVNTIPQTTSTWGFQASLFKKIIL